MLLHPIDSAGRAGPSGWLLSWWLVVLAVLPGAGSSLAESPPAEPLRNPPRATPSLAELLERLESPDMITRARAVQDLGDLGPKARRAIPRLLARLTDPAILVRHRAVQALNRIDPDWPATAAARNAFFLLGAQLHFQQLDDAALLIRQVSIPLLRQVVVNGTSSAADRKTFLEFLEQMERPTSGLERGDIIAAMTCFGSRVVPFLIRQLASNDLRIELTTEHTLDQIAPDWPQSPAAREAIPLFRECLTHGDLNLRKARARVLARIGPGGPETVPARIQRQVDLLRLAEEFPHVQLEAVSNLVKIGPAAREAVADEAVPVLVRLLDQFSVGRQAMQLLERIGPDAKRAIPSLVARLARSDEDHPLVVRLLGKIGPAAVPEILERVSSNNGRVRATAVEALGEIGPGARSALPDLILCRGDADDAVRTQAERALGKVDPSWARTAAARQAIPGLIKRLNSDVTAQPGAAETLGEIGPPAREAIPELVKCLGSNFEPVREAARTALGKIGQPTRESVPELIKQLTGDCCSIRETAADLLARLGSDGKAAIPALVARLADNGPEAAPGRRPGPGSDRSRLVLLPGRSGIHPRHDQAARSQGCRPAGNGGPGPGEDRSSGPRCRAATDSMLVGSGSAGEESRQGSPGPD